MNYWWVLLLHYLTCSILFQSMESKLLVGGKNIVDHTNEQQKMLELRRQEITAQVRGRKKACCFGTDGQ